MAKDFGFIQPLSEEHQLPDTDGLTIDGDTKEWTPIELFRLTVPKSL
ncbi:hypothetical protein [Heyndrickxia sporothermodurans]|nr:hypothetical protein [Heyndrickxia sporothermodurans]MBL5803462.1 hypothetical protein [Heyndrickxia sporothermodurans]